MAGPPLEGGVVEIEDGVVVDIHLRPHSRTVDLGNVALLPGLVNCHTHLEFSNLGHPLEPPHPFAAWIGSVVSERRRRSRLSDAAPGERLEADPVALGLEECFRTGSSVIADIVTGSLDDSDQRSAIIDAMRQGRLIPFRELLAPKPAGVAGTWDAAEASLRDVESAAPGATAGLSPHAPYTVTDDLLAQAIDRAGRESRPVAMHVAETLEELDFLKHRTGPLAEMLQRVGQWDPAATQATRPLDVLRVLSGAPRGLVVHGNYLDSDELRFLGERSHMTLVYCPRTHSYFGHAPYPLGTALRSGVRVALGTDSRASNPDLNLWEEAKAVARAFPGVDGTTIMRMATVNGAEALGVAATHGVLDSGRRADLCCVELDPEVADSVAAALGSRARVVGAMQSGRWLTTPASVKA